MRFERNPVTDTELQHCPMGMHLVDKPEAFHDAMIQVDEFSFRQMINVDAIHGCWRIIRLHHELATGNFIENPEF